MNTWKEFCNVDFVRHYNNYFPIKLVKTVDIPPTKVSRGISSISFFPFIFVMYCTVSGKETFEAFTTNLSRSVYIFLSFYLFYLSIFPFWPILVIYFFDPSWLPISLKILLFFGNFGGFLKLKFDEILTRYRVWSLLRVCRKSMHLADFLEVKSPPFT